MKFDKHIFICTNEKEGKKCCGENAGILLVEKFKKIIKENNIKNVRAQKAGCLDACSEGPALVVYPEGTYYGRVSPDDVNEIFNEHILNNRPVERLILKFE